MTTYKITIKDNSIPEHMQKAIPNFHNEYTAIIRCNNAFTVLSPIRTHCDYQILDYIHSMATELDTDPESLEILSIIKQ
jgi:hypothetical protein